LLVMVAAAILMATILYLVDKNQQWPNFLRIGKWGSITAIVGAALIFGYARYNARTSSHTIIVDQSELEDAHPSPSPVTPKK